MSVDGLPTMTPLQSIETIVRSMPRAAFAATADAASGALAVTCTNAAFAALMEAGGAHEPGTAGAPFPPARFGRDVAERIAAAVRQGRGGRFDLDAADAPPGLPPQRIEVELLHLGEGAWLGLLADVAAERRALELLAESESRYRSAAESGSDWVWETDSDHRFRWLSPRHAAMGVIPDALALGHVRWEFSPDPPDGPAWAAHRAALDRRLPFRDFDHRKRLPDGSIRHVRISGKPFYGTDGQFLGYRGTGRDVTAEFDARRQAELAEARLADAIDSFRDGFALFDAEDRLVRASRRLLEMTGPVSGLFRPGARYADILRGAAAAGRFMAGTQEELERFVAIRLEQHGNPPTDIEYQTGDGRWLRLSETRTGDGGVAMVFSDITNLKRAEAALRKAAEEAEAASQAKSQFLANMSHELRTPLNAIIGFAEIIADEILGHAAQDRYRAYARDIRASGMHLLDVISQVLDMSKIDAGRFDLREERIDLAEVTMSATRLVERLARDAKLQLSVDLPPDLPMLMADRRALRQILINLLSNAIKFTGPGGRVALAAAIEPGGDLAIAVSDTGIGIAEQDIPTALAPFGQIDSAMTRERPGTGLGLPIVKALTELHGGSLAIESKLGVGTTVRLRLPARRLVQAEKAAATPTRLSVPPPS
ncbi:MAG: ATP-binding protein [Alphaproteobacteria bacterium]|nr:ATP-binding protein [Alphaproteobacteria bacterium]